MANDFFQFDTGTASDKGCVRDHNEDSHLADPEAGIWIVADGMGGHAAGDVASGIITEELTSVGRPGSAEDLQARFMERLSRAHRRIQDHAETLGGKTMGATIVGLLAFDDAYACIWSGDSRIYRWRDGILTQLTRDHTELNHLLDTGALTPDEAATFPRKNVITRAIGVSSEPECEVATGALQDGDVFLLCSDGLTEHLSDTDIAVQMSRVPAQMVCDRLLAEVMERGARDNVTAVIVRCLSAPPPADEDWEV